MDRAKIYFFSQLLCVYVSGSLGGIHPDGVSEVGHLQDDQGNYQFGYKVIDQEGEHFRREGTDSNGAVIGSYGLTEADGRHRIVDYIADEHGFRANVRTNEPGTAASNPAGVMIKKEGYAGPATHLDTAATSISSSTRNPPKEHPERVFGIRLTPPASHRRNSDLDTPYERTNPPAYPPEADITPEADPKRVRSYPPTHSRDPTTYYPPLNPISPSSNVPEYQPARIPAVQSSPSQPHGPLPDSSRPYLPPYGGGYEPLYINGYGDRNIVNRRPDISVTAIHGGYMRDPFVSSRPRQHYGVRDGLPRRSDYPPVHDDRIIIPTRNDITVPSTNNPNLVLRAVPIPNGIQAVHVDPSTGEVHRNVVYPAFDRHGRNFWDYNRNTGVLNTFPDTNYANRDQDGYTTYGPSGYPDNDLRYIPDTRRRFPNIPQNAERPLYAGEGVLRNRQPVTTPEDLSLSTPSARDLAGLPPYVRYGYDADPGSYRGGVNFGPYPNTQNYDSTSRDRYPSRYDIPDVYHPGYTDQVDYDNSQNGFNPYFGALPSSPATNTHPNYQRAGLLASQRSKGEKVASDSGKKSSVEFVDEKSH